MKLAKNEYIVCPKKMSIKMSENCSSIWKGILK